MPNIDVRHLGDYIREQRGASDISLRQLAKLAGVSNPYLSQIEGGLRKPSAEILQQIAKALRISAEALYVQAGILEKRQGSGLVADAVHADEGLNERQKQVLLEIYGSFRRENAVPAAASTVTADEAAVAVVTTTDLLSTDLLTSDLLTSDLLTTAEAAPASRTRTARRPAKAAAPQS